MSNIPIQRCYICRQVFFVSTQLDEHIKKEHALSTSVEAAQKIDEARKRLKISSSLWEKNAETKSRPEFDATKKGTIHNPEESVKNSEANDFFNTTNFFSEKFYSSRVTFVLKNLEHLWPPGCSSAGLNKHGAIEIGKAWLTKFCRLLKGKKYKPNKHANIDFMTLLKESFYADPFLSGTTLKKLQRQTGLSKLGINWWFRWMRNKLHFTSPKQIMASTFNQNQFPEAEIITMLTKATGLNQSKIKSWFRVSRALSNIFDPKLADKEELILWRMFKRKIKGISDEDVDLMADLLQMEKLHIYKIFLTWCQRYEVDNFMTPVSESATQQPHQSNIHYSSKLFDETLSETAFAKYTINNNVSIPSVPISPTNFDANFSAPSKESFKANISENQLSTSDTEPETVELQSVSAFPDSPNSPCCSKSTYCEESSAFSPLVENKESEPVPIEVIKEELDDRNMCLSNFKEYPLLILDKIDHMPEMKNVITAAKDVGDKTPATKIQTSSENSKRHQPATPTSLQGFIKTVKDLLQTSPECPVEETVPDLHDQFSDHQLVLNVLEKLRRKQRKRGIPYRVKVTNFNIQRGELFTTQYRRKARDLKRLKNRFYPSYSPRRKYRRKEDSDVEFVCAYELEKSSSDDTITDVLEELYKYQQKQKVLQFAEPWQRKIVKPVGSPTDAEKALFDALQEQSSLANNSINHDSVAQQYVDSSDDDCLHIVEDSDHESCENLQRTPDS